MAKNKTTETEVSVGDFISGLETEQRRKDCLFLLPVMEQISGYRAKMWGSDIIGFGSYHYKYESGHAGDAPLIGFSPRKTAISLYTFTGLEEHLPLLEGLGHYKMGKACLYVRKAADLEVEKLTTLCRATIEFLKSRYQVG